MFILVTKETHKSIKTVKVKASDRKYNSQILKK